MGRKNETTPNDTLMTPRFPEVSFGVVSPRRGNDPTTKRHLAAKRSKYGAKRAVRLDGEKFDSRGEMRWLAGLERLERQGKISDLRRQVTLDLEFNGRPVRSLRSGRAHDGADHCIVVPACGQGDAPIELDLGQRQARQQAQVGDQ